MTQCRRSLRGSRPGKWESGSVKLDKRGNHQSGTKPHPSGDQAATRLRPSWDQAGTKLGPNCDQMPKTESHKERQTEHITPREKAPHM